jgi:hypothetical protein
MCHNCYDATQKKKELLTYSVLNKVQAQNMFINAAIDYKMAGSGLNTFWRKIYYRYALMS